jgi:hypothetical protein
MATSYLTQQISQFFETNISVIYVRPLVHNLNSGTYLSEIKDIKEVVDSNGNFEAFDFYHCLIDSDGNVTHVRFRYYEKELPALASSFKQYPNVKTWQNLVGLKEEVTIAPKPTGNYMYIATRRTCSVNVTSISSNDTVINPHPSKRGSLSSRLVNRSSKFAQTTRQALISDDEEDIDDDFDDFLDDTED